MQAVSARTSTRSGTVLIVEDDPTMASAIRGALEDEGLRAEIASSVEEATRRFDPGTTSLVLLDWTLPDGTGEDVMRAIRPLDASVPIVVMSAQRDAIVASYAIEARERVSKPFDLERLVNLVRRTLG
jgi:DNA-binding response OmpR family regulator